MPSKSKAQQHLMAAAEHGANFPMAKHLRQSMTHEQLHDFAVGSEAHKPEHAHKHKHPQHSHVVHHSDGTKTVHHYHHPVHIPEIEADKGDSSHAVPDLEGMKTNFEDQMGAPNEGEAEAEATHLTGAE